jgi:hypothetical protein
MDLKGFLPSLRGALKLVEDLAPIVKAVGGPAIANLADLAATAAAIGRNVMTRADEAKVVIGEADQKEAKAIIDKLAAVNDELAAKIAES